MNAQDIAQASTYGGLMHRAMGEASHPDALLQVVILNPSDLAAIQDPFAIAAIRLWR